MGVDALVAADLAVGGTKAVRRERKRKPTLASVAKEAAKAGINVDRYEIDPIGKIAVIVSKDKAGNGNSDYSLDRELAEFEARHGKA